jgi:conjugal transfer mating pair stabilization protein TraN
MQDQIRKQGIGGGWGSGKHPNCGGLYTSQLAGVNWDAVHLTEWLALLSIGGRYPTQRQISLDGLTGSGSQFNFGNTSSPRLDAAQRTQERISQSGEDLEQLRIRGGLNLWGQGGKP